MSQISFIGMSDFLSLITEIYSDGKVQAAIQEVIHPLEYFESDKELKLYKQIGSKIYKAVFPNGLTIVFQGEELNLEKFKSKFLYLKRAFRLIEDIEEEEKEEIEPVEVQEETKEPIEE